MGTSELLWGQPDKMLTGILRWTSIPSRGSRNTLSRFILQKPELSAGLMGLWLAQLRLGQNLPYLQLRSKLLVVSGSYQVRSIAL